MNKTEDRRHKIDLNIAQEEFGRKSASPYLEDKIPNISKKQKIFKRSCAPDRAAEAYNWSRQQYPQRGLDPNACHSDCDSSSSVVDDDEVGTSSLRPQGIRLLPDLNLPPCDEEEDFSSMLLHL